MSGKNEPVDGSGAVDVPNPEDVAGQSTNSTDEPDYRSMYEELQQESQAKSGQLEAQLNQAKAAAEARMQSLENLVVQMSNQNNAAGPEPIDPDDPAAAFKYAERLVQQTREQDNRVHEARYNQLAGQALESEKRRVDTDNPLVVEKYSGEIDAYYAQNPDEKNRPGSYEDIVTYLRGKHFDELAKAKEEEYKRRLGSPGRLAEIYGRLEGRDAISAEEYLAVKENYEDYPGRRPRKR
jgi:hypothetical protein